MKKKVKPKKNSATQPKHRNGKGKWKSRKEILSKAFERLDKCREYQKRDNWSC